jgi:hypothetical protein
MRIGRKNLRSTKSTSLHGVVWEIACVWTKYSLCLGVKIGLLGRNRRPPAGSQVDEN